MPRILLAGTQHLASDWILGPGWGSTASINPQVANDQAGEIIVVPGGAGIARNPTLRLVFRDGLWERKPVNVLYTRTDLAVPKTAKWGLMLSDDAGLAFFFAGLPVKNQNYQLNYLVFGR